MRNLTRFYGWVIALGDRSQIAVLTVSLAVLRLIWGFEFFKSGLGKWNSIHEVIGFFSAMHIPFPKFNAYFVATSELIGGLLLLVGLCSRISGLLLSLIMVGAYWLGHNEAVRALFSNPTNFVQQSPFWFLITALFVFCFGPGALSMDALLKWTVWGKTKAIKSK